MGWTKDDLIAQAFSEIGLAVNVFNVAPEQLDRALRSLDSMMATWNAKGIRLGYALPSSPGDSETSQESGLPDSAVETVYLNLAVRIAPGFGKVVSPDVKISARQGYDALLIAPAFPPQQQFPSTLPLGAGNKPWRTQQPFMPTPLDPLMVTEGGAEIDFE